VGGFVRGTANIRLAAEPPGTRVASDVDVQVGGLVAAVGSRLIDTAARKLADDFFQHLAAEIGARTV
jgi:carbon monoxide dehydrogenase subunit G